MSRAAILVLTSTYPRWAGDTEPAFVHELSRRLSGDYEVHVLAPHFQGAKRVEVMDGVQVHRFRYFLPSLQRLAYEGGMLTNVRRAPWLLLLLPLFLVSQFLTAWRLARANRVTLVHAHWVIPQGVVAWLLKVVLPSIRLVVTSHGGDVYGLNGGLMRWLKTRVYGVGNVVTVVSQAMAATLGEQVTGVDIRVAPMGVDLRERFTLREPVEERSGLIFVGRLVEKKGVATLLEAFARTSAEHPEQRLTVVGDGPDREALQRQAAGLGIGDVVHFQGAVPNTAIPDLLNSHAVSVVPSVVASSGDQEGLGLVTIEAMGCGCAVVASDLPAIHDVVQHGENGLMAPAGDAAAFADAIQALLKDDELRTRLALAGRRSVESTFDWSVAAGRYLELFRSLGSRDAGPPHLRE